MVITGLVIIFFCITLVAYLIMIYNNLVALKENNRKAWANVDVILKQRHDELPKLVEVCQSCMDFEKSVIDRVMSAREKYFRAETVPQKAQADAEISSALKSLFALVENYPQLKSDARFAALQERITHLEEGLSDRREFYNDSVNNYNIRIQQIPDCFVAAFLYLRKEPLFKASSEDRKDVAIKFRSSN